MPIVPKANLLAFAKQKASPPPAAGLLAQKRSMVKKPAPVAPGAKPAGAPQPQGAGGQQVHAFELVEEAAQEAEAGANTALEDIISGTENADPTQPPAWAEDPNIWAEAVQAVGIGAGAEEKYAEPFVVAAYLYAKLGGPVTGLAPDGAAQPAAGQPAPQGKPPAPGQPPGQTDVTKPGAAAKAIHAAAAAKKAPGGAAPAGGAPKGPPGAPPAKGGPPGAPPGGKKPTIGNPALAKHPAHGTDKAPPKDATGGKDGAKPLEEGKDAGGGAPQVPEPHEPLNLSPEMTQQLQGYDPERDGNPPSWIADEATWEKAKKAVEPRWAEYDEPYAVVAHVYESMGGKTK